MRRVIAETVHKHVQSDDPIFIANWLRHTYMTRLPSVPICGCGATMTATQYTLVSGSERAFEPDARSWTGYRPVPGPEMYCRKIERYVCPRCHAVRIASRENDPLVLLRTRTGRCGEFAILYTSILLALGHQARLLLTVKDDHVFTEVRVGGEWVPVDVSAEDLSRLIRDRYLFERWKWKLADLYAIAPGELPILVGETYRRKSAEERA